MTRAELAALKASPSRSDAVIAQMMQQGQEASLLDRLPELVYIADASGRALFVNTAFLDVTGLSPASALGDGWLQAVYEPDREPLLEQWRRAVAKGGSFSGEFRLNQPNGAPRWYRSRAARLSDDDGAPPRWYGLCVDIDDMKVAEVALQRSEAALRISLVNQQRSEQRFQEVQAGLAHHARLSVVGEFASALAHELNQPLTAATNYASAVARLIAADQYAAREDIAAAADSASRQLVRAGNIVRGLREFVSKGHAERSIGDLKAAIEEATDVALVGIYKAGIGVRLSLTVEPAPVLMNKVQVQQVLVNLVRNAIEAMRDSVERQLEITLHRESAEDGERAVVCVADTGPGIADSVAGQLFLPFVTSKRDGVGVGLSISKAIVASHQGTIWHEPRERRGAVFKFSLPIAGDVA